MEAEKVISFINNKQKIQEYEVCWKGMSRDMKIWVSREILVNMGSISQVQRFDEKTQEKKHSLVGVY